MLKKIILQISLFLFFSNTFSCELGKSIRIQDWDGEVSWDSQSKKFENKKFFVSSLAGLTKHHIKLYFDSKTCKKDPQIKVFAYEASGQFSNSEKMDENQIPKGSWIKIKVDTIQVFKTQNSLILGPIDLKKIYSQVSKNKWFWKLKFKLDSQEYVLESPLQI